MTAQEYVVQRLRGRSCITSIPVTRTNKTFIFYTDWYGRNLTCEVEGIEDPPYKDYDMSDVFGL